MYGQMNYLSFINSFTLIACYYCTVLFLVNIWPITINAMLFEVPFQEIVSLYRDRFVPILMQKKFV